jgi:hypothetical protein
VDGLVIGVEVYLGFVELLTSQHFLHHAHEIAQHTTSIGLLTDVHQIDKDALRRHTGIYPE